MTISLKDGAQRVLEEASEPLHYREITKRLLDKGIADSQSQTPSASVNAVLAVDIKRKGKDSAFVRVSPGVFGLRGHVTLQSVEDINDDPERRVRIPNFPPYSEVRLVLPIWNGMQRSLVTGLHSTIATLRGTPQEPADWSSPDEWIPDRLSGSDRKTALAVSFTFHTFFNGRVYTILKSCDIPLPAIQLLISNGSASRRCICHHH